MDKIAKIDCYIEEYRNEQGNLSARFRDKILNKRVSITGFDADKTHLLIFLSQAKLNQHIMPTIFDKDGIDIVEVRGIIVFEDDQEIIVNIDAPLGGYLFA